MSNIAEEFEKINKIRDKIPGFDAALACEKFTQFGNTLSDAEREEFERWKRRESNAVYGLDTGEGEDQSANYYQVINSYNIPADGICEFGGDSAWTTVKIDLPKRYLNISEDLDRVLESSDLMKELNELCIRDTQELYVRELLNRIDRCCRWLEANKYNWGFHMDIPIAILKNDLLKIQEEYVMFRKIKDTDNEYQRDGIEIIAEILGVKDE